MKNKKTAAPALDVTALAMETFEANCLVATAMHALSGEPGRAASVTLATALSKLQAVERALRQAEAAVRGGAR